MSDITPGVTVALFAYAATAYVVVGRLIYADLPAYRGTGGYWGAATPLFGAWLLAPVVLLLLLVEIACAAVRSAWRGCYSAGVGPAPPAEVFSPPPPSYHRRVTPEDNPMPASKAFRPHVRAYLTSDAEDVLRVDRQHPTPWAATDLCRFVRKPRNLLVVAALGRQVVGYLAYRLTAEGVALDRLVVISGYQRAKIGTALVSHVMADEPYDAAVSAVVPDDNLAAHLFLKKLGFKAAPKVERRRFGEADGYRFVRPVRVREEAGVS